MTERELLIHRAIHPEDNLPAIEIDNPFPLMKFGNFMIETVTDKPLYHRGVTGCATDIVELKVNTLQAESRENTYVFFYSGAIVSYVGGKIASMPKDETIRMCNLAELRRRAAGVNNALMELKDGTMVISNDAYYSYAKGWEEFLEPYLEVVLKEVGYDS